MKLFLRMLYVVVALFFGLLLAVLWMAGGIQSPTTSAGPIAKIDGAKTSTGAETIDVLVWNIAWAYGWGSEGSGGARPSEHFERSLERIGAVVKSTGADLVLLQEVDFGATRSHGVDQARRIAEIAGLHYVAYAESWRANWVPFPYWPVENHFGRMSSGGAILSRYPLENNVVELLDKPAENPFWYNLFYLFRFVQSVDTKIDDRTVRVYNTHLDAFSRDNREAQARRVAEKLAEDDGVVIFGGDLNSVPPESDVQKGYSDEPGTDHEGDHTVATLRSVTGLSDTIPSETFASDQTAYFTFPAHAPNRKLDHLFVTEELEVETAKVWKDAGDVSDHLPLYARLRLR